VVKVLWDGGIDNQDIQTKGQQAVKHVRNAIQNALDCAMERGEISPGDNEK